MCERRSVSGRSRVVTVFVAATRRSARDPSLDADNAVREPPCRRKILRIAEVAGPRFEVGRDSISEPTNYCLLPLGAGSYNSLHWQANPTPRPTNLATGLDRSARLVARRSGKWLRPPESTSPTCRNL